MKAARWAWGGAWGGVLLLVLILTWRGGMPGRAPAVDVLYVEARTPDEILALDGPLVAPVAYREAPSLVALDPEARKRKFADLMVPAILVSRARLQQQRLTVERILADPEPTAAERRWVAELQERYRAPDTEALRRRLRGHPTSVVLAQAALESGWGTSRFFTAANNVFGTWSFDRDEPRLAAAGTRDGARPHLKRYDSLIEAVDDYFLTIARGPYLDFRLARLDSAEPDTLIPHLVNYSELRDEYTQRLLAVIESGDLRRYDSWRLDPRYLREGGP